MFCLGTRLRIRLRLRLSLRLRLNPRLRLIVPCLVNPNPFEFYLMS